MREKIELKILILIDIIGIDINNSLNHINEKY